MNIVFCTDNNYVMPCGIAIISLFENNKDTEINIHIIGSNISDVSENILKGITDKYGAQIFFYSIEEKDLKKFDQVPVGSQHLTSSCYTRLFLANILPHHIEKIIYLDCDLIILDKLSELWNTNINGFSVAGVIDSPTFLAKTYEELKYSDKYPYINSGVLLINLKYWRDNDVITSFLMYSQNNYENIRWNDQDIINGVLHNSILLLSIRYNIHHFFFKRRFDVDEYKKDREHALRNPVIVHFTNPAKPWFKESDHPMTDKYLEYKKISPWKDTLIGWGNIPLKRKIKYYKRLILYSLGIKNKKSVDQILNSSYK